jgi:hypothetical protein
MARLSRITVPDLPHHVTQRSNRRQDYGDSAFNFYFTCAQTLQSAPHLTSPRKNGARNLLGGCGGRSAAPFSPCGRRWASCQRRSDEGYSGGTLASTERVERSLALLRKAPHLTCCAGHLLPQGEKKDKLDSLTIRTYSYYSSQVISCRTSGAVGTVRGDPQLERFFAPPLSRNWN